MMRLLYETYLTSTAEKYEIIAAVAIVRKNMGLFELLHGLRALTFSVAMGIMINTIKEDAQ